MSVCFDRFQKEVRAEMDKKTQTHTKLSKSIAALNSQITRMNEDNEKEVERIKVHDAKIQREHTERTSELQQKLKRQKLQHDASVCTIAEGLRHAQAKEDELVSMKSTVGQLQNTIAQNKVQEDAMNDAIDEYSVKIGLVEMEIESVRMRNKEIHAENKKMQERMGAKAREQEHQKAEMASFRPKMLDMADRMVTEYRKINKQLVKIDEKQKRIIAEKTAIIMQLQSAKSPKM